MTTQFRNVRAARNGVVEMITRDIREKKIDCEFNPDSPDGDPSKFTINGKVARAMHLFAGYHLPIRLEWFSGDEVPPIINRGEFYYYVFAIEPRLSYGVRESHYLIIDYHTVRKWVLEFEAPAGRDWRDQAHWMASIRPFSDGTAYFRWGDESLNDYSHKSRLIQVDNLRELIRTDSETTVGGGGRRPGSGGESDDHRQLKKLVASQPSLIGLGSEAISELEHVFISDDRVDVLFTGGGNDYTVVEVELSGELNLIKGVHQAIKYRALKAAEERLPNLGPSTKVRAIVVANEIEYTAVRKLADLYEIELIAIDHKA